MNSSLTMDHIKIPKVKLDTGNSSTLPEDMKLCFSIDYGYLSIWTRDQGTYQCKDTHA